MLTLALPPPEALGGPDLSPGFARVANDGMAAMVAKWPDKFPAFVATLPMNNVPAALEEMDRAVGTLGAHGIQLATSVNGRPLDEEAFFPVWERVTVKYGMPVWMHPALPFAKAGRLNVIADSGRHRPLEKIHRGVRDQGGLSMR